MARASTKRSAKPETTIEGPCAATCRVSRHRKRDRDGQSPAGNAIISTKSKWANGTVLHYAFFSAGHFAVPKLRPMPSAPPFANGKAVASVLYFRRSANSAKRRSGSATQQLMVSSASAVGRAVLKVPTTEPTTVYGGNYNHPTGREPRCRTRSRARMEHEHQNPFAGISA